MKNGLSKVILFIIILLMIFLCGVAYCYFKTDLFKTPDVLFQKYLSKNVTQIINSNYEPFGSAFKKMNSGTFEDDFKVEMDMKKLYGDEFLSLLDEEEVEKLASTYSLDYILKSDVQKNKAEMIADLKMGEYESKLNTIATTEEISIQLDELNEKHLVVQNKELKKLFEKLGLDEEELEKIPDKIITDVNYEEQAAKIKSLEEKYISKIFDQISEDKYSINKKVNVEYNGENYTSNKYTLTLTDKEVAKIFITVYKELLDDQEFLSLIPEEEKANFEEQISELKKEIADLEEKIEELDGSNIELSVYDISNELTKIELKYKEDSIVIHSKNVEGNNNIRIDVNSGNEETITITIDNQYSGNEGTLTISILEDSKENKIILKSNSDGNNIKTTISLDGEAFEEVNKALTITNTIKFDDVKFTSVDEDNSIILNDLSEDELEDLIGDIQENLEKCTEPDSGSLIGMLVQKVYGTFSSDSDYDFGEYNSLNQNNNLLVEDDEENIEEERQEVEDEIEDVLTELLNEYHREKITNDDANPADYLTSENIESRCDYAEASIVDGNTIKSVKGDNVYFTKIYIDGTDWSLTNVETTYSESGEIE